jgi:hypothetical protein
VTETTKRVWAGIDCTTCASCGREVPPTLNEEKVGRLARRLGMVQKEPIDAYLKPTESLEENLWEMRTKPCPFRKDNRCTVDQRPAWPLQWLSLPLQTQICISHYGDDRTDIYPNSAESPVLQGGDVERGERSSPCAKTFSRERKPSSCICIPSLCSKPKGGSRPDRLPSEP